MGFFKRFNPIRAINRIIQPVINNPIKAITGAARTALQDPVRFSLGVATGGVSELARVAPIIGDTYKKTVSFASEGYKIGANVYTGGLYGAATGIGESVLSPRQGEPMAAFNVGQFLGGVGKIFGGSQNQYLSQFGNVAQLASQFAPQMPQVQQFVPQNVMSAITPPQAMMPRIGGPMSRAVATVGRGFFNKFPSLAAGMQQLRARGQNIKRSQLYSMLRRFGPEVLVTGGLLTAAAVSELMMAGPGRKRMNPANVKALRRSMRRLDSFHKLCVSADKLRKPKSRKCK